MLLRVKIIFFYNKLKSLPLSSVFVNLNVVMTGYDIQSETLLSIPIVLVKGTGRTSVNCCFIKVWLKYFYLVTVKHCLRNELT